MNLFTRGFTWSLHAFLTSKFFYIQDGIWKWHCFDAETWQEKKGNNYSINN